MIDYFQELLDRTPVVGVIHLLTLSTEGERPKHFDYIQKGHKKPAVKIYNAYSNRVSDKTLKEKNGRYYFIASVDRYSKKTFYLDEFIGI